MADPHIPSTPDESQRPPYTGPERRSGNERRKDPNPQPAPGQGERRTWVRRKADRLALGGAIRIGLGKGERVYRRVRIEAPVICRPLASSSMSDQPARRGMTCGLAPGGLGMLLEEEFPVGTFLEVLVRFEGDLLAADVQVVSVRPQGGKILHNCRFTPLGTADRNWLAEYLQLRDGQSA